MASLCCNWRLGKSEGCCRAIHHGCLIKARLVEQNGVSPVRLIFKTGPIQIRHPSPVHESSCGYLFVGRASPTMSDPILKWSSRVVSVKDAVPVTVPCGGWYGICFGSSSRDEAPRTDNLDDAGLVLEVWQDTSLCTSHKLPFVVQDDSLQVITVGKLMYLAERSTLTVRTKLESHISNEFQSKEQDGAPLFLQVVLHKNTDILTLQEKEDLPTSGTLATLKKTVVCAECCKTYASLKAVTTHIHNQHAATPLDPMWTTPLPVVYQDNSIAVIIKPQGMPVMGDKQTLGRSDLLLALRNSSQSADDDPALSKPRVAHRLDAATGGLVLVCKTYKAERLVKEAFENRRVTKTYRALVVGRVQADAGVCNQPLSDKASVSNWRVLQRIPSVT